MNTIIITNTTNTNIPQNLNVVQFMHPGGEHILSLWEKKHSWKLWNTGGHKRKFMKAIGSVIDNEKIVKKDVPLYFWSEWEPDSVVNLTGVSSPKYLHEPVLVLNRRGLPSVTIHGEECQPTNCTDDCLNTDPFVFGDNFLYSLCQQRNKNNTPTSLQKLQIGNLILFGSCKKRSNGYVFMLDTVFVVADKRDYTAKTYKKNLNGFIPRHYDYIMGFKYRNNQTANYLCYQGANINNPIDGMYSFVPCKTSDGADVYFDRIELKDSDFANLNLPHPVISNGLTQGFRKKRYTQNEVKQIWNRIVTIIKNRGYEQGEFIQYNVYSSYASATKKNATLASSGLNTSTINNK